LHKGLSEQWGIGGSVIVDRAGPVSETNAYIDLAYSLNFKEDQRLAFGLKLGATFHDIGLADLEVFDPNDPFFSENISSVTPNLGAGVFYYTNRFYAGFSIPNLLASVHLDANGFELGSETQHYFLTAGMVFQVAENIALKPSFLLKSAFNAPTSLDLNLNSRFYERVEIGVSYRTDDAISALVNFQITPYVRLGYAYDYITSELNPFGASSSEVLLLIDLLPKQKRVKSPRFF
jgi:type IX secretion system PorP/SprF family membrane protein